MTEITDNIDVKPTADRGVIFYDAACGVCRGGAERFRRRVEGRGFDLVPLQSALATKMTGASSQALMEEVYLVTAAPRRVLRGIDAVLYAARAGAVPFARSLRWIAKVPGALPLMRMSYRAFARHRYGVAAACGLQGRRSPLSVFGPPALLVTAALVIGPSLGAWQSMWTIALALFFACKWITWCRTQRVAEPIRTLAYFFANPGMDAESFFGVSRSAKPRAAEWSYAVRNTVLGAAMIGLLPRLLLIAHPTVAIWSAMIGMVLALHFGAFHLITLAWQSRGVVAEPLMNRPSHAVSLGEFWGKRWNTGFSTLARELVFTPLIRRGAGTRRATAAVFLVSGILHDLVISLPARGGYGLPTFYFLLQLLGVLIERRPVVRAALRRRPVLARVYTLALLVLPLPCLFHDAFVTRVVVPFLHAIGGLP